MRSDLRPGSRSGCPSRQRGGVLSQAWPAGGVVFEKERFRSTTASLRELEAWLAERQVSWSRWRPPACIGSRSTTRLSRGSRCGCATLATLRRSPGRKTDMTDAEWLADVAAHGMIRASFVPPPPIRELRELTRYRKTQSAARAAEIQRLGEGAAGRRDQADLGRLEGPDSVGAGDDRGADRRRARRREARRAGDGQDAPEGPGAHRGADRPLRLPPRRRVRSDPQSPRLPQRVDSRR